MLTVTTTLSEPDAQGPETSYLNSYVPTTRPEMVGFRTILLLKTGVAGPLTYVHNTDWGGITPGLEPFNTVEVLLHVTVKSAPALTGVVAPTARTVIFAEVLQVPLLNIHVRV